MLTNTLDLDEAAASKRSPVARWRCVAALEPAPGQGCRILLNVRGGAGGHDFSALGAAAWSQVDDVIGVSDGVLVVLDDDDRVASALEDCARCSRVLGCHEHGGRSWVHRGCSRHREGSSRVATPNGYAGLRRRIECCSDATAGGRKARPESEKTAARLFLSRCSQR